MRSALSANGAERSFDPFQVLYFVWRRWKFILATTAVVLLATWVWLDTATPRYTATTQILLDPVDEKLASADIVSANALDTLTMDNQVAIVKSTALLRRVVEKERLVDDSEFGSRRLQAGPRFGGVGLFFSRIREVMRPYLAYTADDVRRYFPGAEKTVPQSRAEAGGPSAEIGVNAESQHATGTDASDNSVEEIMDAVGALAGAVSAKRVGQADVLSISVSSTDRGRAARLANAVAEAYLVDPLYSRLEAGRRTSAWINERLPELRERWREFELAVVSFRAEHNLVENSQNITLNQDQMAQLNARLVAVRAEVAEKKAKVDLLDKLDAQGGDNGAMPDIANSGPIVTLRNQLAEISTREAGLTSCNSANYPELIKLRAERAEVQSALAAQEREIAKTIRNEYSLALARRDLVEKIWREVAGRTSLDDKEAIELSELERTASVRKDLFDNFLKRSGLLQEDTMPEARIGRVIVPALRPGVPSFPNKRLILPVGLALGLALGVGVSWAREKLSAGFTTSRQVEDVLALPLLVSIHRMERRETKIDGGNNTLPRLIRMKPLSSLSEAGRALRSGIKMINVERPPKIVQVTSSATGEGKTTTALLLASSSAAAGLKTLIVDADQRNPSISHYFNLNESVGLVDLLLGRTNVEDTIRFDDAYGLWVMPAGVACENLGDLLISDRIRRLVENLGSKFDCVVFDTSPVAPAADARFISNFVDKIIFVVKWSSTRRDIVLQTLKILPNQEKIAGVVLNCVDKDLVRKYN